jgi:hypothetical protein
MQRESIQMYLCPRERVVVRAFWKVCGSSERGMPRCNLEKFPVVRVRIWEVPQRWESVR